MPTINLGTCCGSEPKVGITPWLAAGGVGIDTAYDYHDQQDIASIIHSPSAPPRSSLFITTKIPAGFGMASQGAQPCAQAFEVKTNISQAYERRTAHTARSAHTAHTAHTAHWLGLSA